MRLSSRSILIVFFLLLFPVERAAGEALSEGSILSGIRHEEHSQTSSANAWERLLSLFSAYSEPLFEQSSPPWEELVYTRSLLPDRDIYEIIRRNEKKPDALVVVLMDAEGYRHTVYEKQPGGFLQKNTRDILIRGSAWFTGLYADINGDGWPDLLRYSSKKYGLLGAKAFTTVEIFYFDPITCAYPDEASLTVKRKGFFLPMLNGFDLDKDGKGDLVFCDLTHGAVTSEQLAEAMWDGRLTLRLYGYLSSDARKGFPEEPSFEHTQKTGISHIPDIAIVLHPVSAQAFLCSRLNGTEQCHAFDSATRKFTRTAFSNGLW